MEANHTTNAALERLAQIIAPKSQLKQVWQLHGGMSAGMTAFALQHVDGHTTTMIRRQPPALALARNPHAARQEFALLQRLKSAGVAVPSVYYLDESSTLFPTPYFVLEYIEGQPEFAPRDRAGFAYQSAAQIANIHQIAWQSNQFWLPRQSLGDVDLRPAHVNDSLQEGRIRATLEATTVPHDNQPVLLHGDFWPGNVLWQHATLVAVIDWEDAAIGDPLGDLAISRLDLCWIFGVDVMHAFTDHYHSLMPMDTQRLAWWDLYAALRFIRLAGLQLPEWAAFFHPYGRADITECSIREHFAQFVAQAFDILAV